LKKSIINKIITSNKIHAIILAIVIYITLVMTLGVDFFCSEIISVIEPRKIEISHFGEIFVILSYDSLKCYIIMFLFVNMFDGDIAKNIILFIATFLYCICIHNVYNPMTKIDINIKNTFVYIPQYLNIITFIFLFDEYIKTIKKTGSKFFRIIKLFAVIMIWCLFIAFLEAMLIIFLF